MIEEFINKLKEHNITLSLNQLKQFEDYFSLIIEYNKVMDLTAVEDNQIYDRHFFDSLTIAFNNNFNNKSLCDVGSGAGFPGIPLKILFPEMKLTIVDSLTKRTKFLNIVIEKLNLKDVTIINDRIENINLKFDIVVARAVASLNILLEICSQVIKTNGNLIAMKGNKALEELNESKNAIKLLNYKYLNIDEFNNLYFLKEKETSNKYPRDYSLIKKKPL